MTEVNQTTELETVALNYLELYDQSKSVEKKLSAAKIKLGDLLDKQGLKKLDFEEKGATIQRRETKKIVWEEAKLYKKFCKSQLLDKIFPKTVDTSCLSYEDLEKAGLLEKCLVRKFDPSTLEALIEVAEVDDKELLKENLVRVDKSYTIARVKFAKAKPDEVDE